MEMSEEILVDIATAAPSLGMARSSLYRLCAAGLVPSYSAGPRLSGVRVCIAEVKAALRKPVMTGQEAKAVEGARV